jgi:hypothetical protein
VDRGLCVKKGQKRDERWAHDVRASRRKEKRVRASMCTKDPEHARFIFTPLIGPCVAIMMRKLRRS